MTEPPTATKPRQRISSRWWFPLAVVVLVLLAGAGAESLGLWQGGEDAICVARDFFVKLAGETPDACP